MDDDDVELDESGLPGRRDCATCGSPLVPELVRGGTLALAWSCPAHGIADLTPDPFAAS